MTSGAKTTSLFSQLALVSLLPVLSIGCAPAATGDASNGAAVSGRAGAGTLGYPCLPAGECAATLQCINDLCLPPGKNLGPGEICAASSDCAGALTCESGRCSGAQVVGAVFYQDADGANGLPPDGTLVLVSDAQTGAALENLDGSGSAAIKSGTFAIVTLPAGTFLLEVDFLIDAPDSTSTAYHGSTIISVDPQGPSTITAGIVASPLQ